MCVPSCPHQSRCTANPRCTTDMLTHAIEQSAGYQLWRRSLSLGGHSYSEAIASASNHPLRTRQKQITFAHLGVDYIRWVLSQPRKYFASGHIDSPSPQAGE